MTGPASVDSPLGTEAIARITREWGLPEGALFKQAAWTLAKERAINTLTGSPYAAARIARSEALIDPERASADLTIELASGPAFGFGQFEITGLSKYEPSLVRNYSTIAPGTPYSDVVLNQYVRRLNASGYFASVQAKIDPETTHPEDATVNIAVIEARPKRFEGGIGYSTDVQFRANASYRDVNFDGTRNSSFLPRRGSKPGFSRGRSSSSARPTSPAGSRRTCGGAERTDIESLITRTAAIGTRWHSIEERNERAISATYYLDEQQPEGLPKETANALYAEYEWHWRRVDDLIAPTTGYTLSLFAGGGVPGVSTRTFGRLRARYACVASARQGQRAQPSRGSAARCSRAAATAFRRSCCFAPAAAPPCAATTSRASACRRAMPSSRGATMRWRVSMSSTGSTRSGASQRSSTRAMPSTRCRNAHLALGYGVGGRVRTPLGPFRLDIAYGQDVHKVRVQFSVGLTF